MTNTPFVSMIKINGTPILPPLIEECERPALRRYREEAIMVEKRLADRAKKQKEKESQLEQHTHDISELSSLSNLDTVQVMNFIRQALKDSAHLDEVRHLQEVILEELQKYEGDNSLTKCDSQDTLHNIDDLSIVVGHSSLDTSLVAPKSSEKSSSSRDFEDNDSVAPSKSACTGNNALATSKVSSQVGSTLGAECLVEPRLSLSYPSIHLIENSSTPYMNDSVTMSEQSTSVEESPPKLIRRNSYTLESPSPSVLLYLKSLNIDDNPSVTSLESQKNVRRNLNQVWGDVTPNVILSNTPTNNSNVSWMSDADPPSTSDVGAQCRVNNSNDSFSPSEKTQQENKMVSNFNHLQQNNINNFNLRNEAAAKIQAGIRGYLTRRLLKTNRIVELKNAIRDSLIAALQMHTGTSASKAELEFHRALTIQVESLCNEWHQIFFDYSPQERMRIIEVDRNKIKTKILKQLQRKTKSGTSISTSQVLHSSTAKVAARPRSLSLHPQSRGSNNSNK